MLKVLLKNFLRLIHNFCAHDNEELSSLESGFGPSEEVVLYDLDHNLLLLWVIYELDQDRCERGCSCRGDSYYTVITELEEHR